MRFPVLAASLVPTLVAGVTMSSGSRSGASRPGDTLFVESFETGTLAAFQDGVDSVRHAVVTDSALAHTGRRALRITYPRGQDGGWLTRFLGSEYDSVYVSFYVRFPSEWVGSTKLMAIYGSRLDDRWSAFGKAGQCPNGSDFFATWLVTVPPGNPGQVRFYTYHPAMRREPNGVTCWGNDLQLGSTRYAEAPGLMPGRWHRLEFYVRLNTPGMADGEQLLWVNGEAQGHWPDLRLRAASILRINAVQLSASMPAGAPQTQSLYVDDIVVLRRPPRP